MITTLLHVYYDTIFILWYVAFIIHFQTHIHSKYLRFKCYSGLLLKNNVTSRGTVWAALGYRTVWLVSPTINKTLTCSDLPAALLHLGGRDWLSSETLVGFTAPGDPRWHVAPSTPTSAIRSCFHRWVSVQDFTFSAGAKDLFKKKKHTHTSKKKRKWISATISHYELGIKHHQHSASGINANFNTFYRLKLIQLQAHVTYHQSWSASLTGHD